MSLMTGNMRNQTFFMTGLNMRVALLALPGSMRSALAGLADMFWLANQVVRMNPTVNPELSRDVPLFDVRTITADGQPVRDVQGRSIESDGAFSGPDTFGVIIASGMQLDEHRFPVDRAAVSNAAEWLKVKYLKEAVLPQSVQAVLYWEKRVYSTDGSAPQRGGYIPLSLNAIHWQNLYGEKPRPSRTMLSLRVDHFHGLIWSYT